MMEDYVTFETAMRLREAGFNWDCYYRYSGKGEFIPVGSFTNSNANHEGCSAPALAQAVKWLERKGLVVTVDFEPLAGLMVYTYTVRYADRQNLPEPDGRRTQGWVMVASSHLGSNPLYGITREYALHRGINAALDFLSSLGNGK